jgi:hypothetical protein
MIKIAVREVLETRIITATHCLGAPGREWSDRRFHAIRTPTTISCAVHGLLLVISITACLEKSTKFGGCGETGVETCSHHSESCQFDKPLTKKRLSAGSN